MSSANSDPLLFIAAPDCAICGIVSALVQTGENPLPSRIPKTMFQPAARFGTVKEYTESAARCSLCRALLAKLTAQPNEENPQPLEEDAVVEMAYMMFMGVWEIMAERLATRSRPNSGTTLSCLHVIRRVGPGDQLVPTYQKGEMLAFVGNHSDVDFSRVKSWISYCDVNHQGTCFQIEDPWKRMDSPHKLYFVDVDEECISLQPGTSIYLTLSYVWGTTPSPLMSMTANINNLCTPHSLAESSPLGKRLPRTIRDAMEVTRKLGYRYLWVDRLCIIQDDEVQKPDHIAAMAGIYGNSAITIIADNGDDAQGLPGVGLDGSTKRRPFDILFFPGNVQLVLNDLQPLDAASQSTTPEAKTYNCRGWTLQEEMLSNRTLKFNPQEVNGCAASRASESYKTTNARSVTTGNPPSRSSSSSPTQISAPTAT